MAREVKLSECKESFLEEVVNLLSEQKSMLPCKNQYFYTFLGQAVDHLFENARISASTSPNLYPINLLHAELPYRESIRFVYDNGFCLPDVGGYDPTIQIVATEYPFHGLLLKANSRAFESLDRQYVIQHEMNISAACITDRIQAEREVNITDPNIAALKSEARRCYAPIIYILGAARQFPRHSELHTEMSLWQQECIAYTLDQMLRKFGNRSVVGTGGWAGTREASLGVPRLGFLEAKKREMLTLSTLPRCGAYDRHEGPTFEAFCGNEWGDDAPAIAQVCDAAIVFGAIGPWTKIELLNLLYREKPFVLLEHHSCSSSNTKDILFKSEFKKNQYLVTRSKTEAAEWLLHFATVQLATPWDAS